MVTFVRRLLGMEARDRIAAAEESIRRSDEIIRAKRTPKVKREKAHAGSEG